MNLFGILRGRKKKALVLGADGMLGTDLAKRLEAGGAEVTGLCKEELQEIEIDRPDGLGRWLDGRRFDLCANCVAMTDTKGAEGEGKALSFRLNALVPAFAARACHSRRVPFVHVSTDYVFGGEKPPEGGRKYGEDDVPSPIGFYGAHKLLGEAYVQKEFAIGGPYAIMRTSWLYGAAGNKSFVHKILKAAVAAQREGRKLEVTSNELSIPTSTEFLSDAIAKLFVEGTWRRSGIYHAVSDDRPVSRADWAREILRAARATRGLGINSPRSGIVVPTARPVTIYPEFSALEASAEIKALGRDGRGLRRRMKEFLEKCCGLAGWLGL